MKPCRAVRRLPTTLALLAGVALLANPAFAHSPVDPGTIGDQHPTGHVGDHQDQTWPPQPRGIDSVVLHGARPPAIDSRAGQEQARAAAENDRRERLALARGDVRRALGTRFQRLGAAAPLTKGTAPGATRLVFFSHSNRSTVEVDIDATRSVRALTIRPAREYQPEITDEETAAAAAIARAHFTAIGRPRVKQLQAFGILAYRPEGTGFYDDRVLYVSFHPSADRAPEMAAWVDLTNGRVLKTLEEPR